MKDDASVYIVTKVTPITMLEDCIPIHFYSNVGHRKSQGPNMAGQKQDRHDKTVWQDRKTYLKAKKALYSNTNKY